MKGKRRKKERGVAVKDSTSFYNRWSQRKSEQQDISKQEKAQQEPQLLSEQQPQPFLKQEPQLSPEQESINQTISTETDHAPPPLTDDDMPSIESLHHDSDFHQFFSPGVSEELRKLALRKLFLLPEFNIRDGLNDYDEDFSKMPELTKAVVDKLRSWINEEQDAEATKAGQLSSQDSKNATACTNTEETEPDTADASPKTAQTEIKHDEQEDHDDLGDADLEG